MGHNGARTKQQQPHILSMLNNVFTIHGLDQFTNDNGTTLLSFHYSAMQYASIPYSSTYHVQCTIKKRINDNLRPAKIALIPRSDMSANDHAAEHAQLHTHTDIPLPTDRYSHYLAWVDLA